VTEAMARVTGCGVRRRRHGAEPHRLTHAISRWAFENTWARWERGELQLWGFGGIA
jgi:hypothetical protein